MHKLTDQSINRRLNSLRLAGVSALAALCLGSTALATDPPALN
jgi:hypothetical protein